MATRYRLCAIPKGAQTSARPRQDWAEADSRALLAAGFAADSSALGALLERLHLSSADAASVVGVHPRTVRAWLAGRGAQPAAVRLLAILAGFVPWDGWEDWEVDGGLLFPPGFSHHGIAPGEFFAVVFYRQQVAELRRMLAEREARIAELEARRLVLEERLERLSAERARRPRRGRRSS